MRLAAHQWNENSASGSAVLWFRGSVVPWFYFHISLVVGARRFIAVAGTEERNTFKPCLLIFDPSEVYHSMFMIAIGLKF
jgi:hypothetical protein